MRGPAPKGLPRLVPGLKPGERSQAGPRGSLLFGHRLCGEQRFQLVLKGDKLRVLCPRLLDQPVELREHGPFLAVARDGLVPERAGPAMS